MPEGSSNVHQGLVQPLAPQEFAPERLSGSSSLLERIVQTRHGPHADRACHDGVALPLDPDLPEIGSDDGEGCDLRRSGQCRRQVPGGGAIVAGIEQPIRNHAGQEAGLVAGRLKVHTDPLDDGREDPVAAIPDQPGGVLTSTLEHEDEGRGRDGDGRGGYARQGKADGQAARQGDGLNRRVRSSPERRPHATPLPATPDCIRHQ